jgi:RecA/RadA recombinase
VPVDPSRRDEFRAWVAQNHPDTRFIERHTGPVPRIPFASRMLTYATSGGVSVGHLCRWYGTEGSGKSLTNWGLIYVAQNYPEVITEFYTQRIHALERLGKKLPAQMQKRLLKQAVAMFPDGMETLIYDTEQRADLEFAAKLGVDPKRVEIVDENVIEVILDQMKEAVAAYHLILVDSVSNAQSVAEAELEPGAYERGTAAQAWKRFRQVRKKLDRGQNTIVFVDQVRTQLGNLDHKGKARVEPAQIRFIKHNASVAIEFSTARKLYLMDNGMVTDDYKKASDNYKALGVPVKEVAGQEMRCYVEKNSTGKPMRHARMRFKHEMMDFRTGEIIQEPGFDDAFELVEVGIDFGILSVKSGGRYTVMDDHGHETKIKAHGEPKMREIVMDDEGLRDRIIGRLVLAT